MMKRETEGFPVTALREITLLKSLAHPNVVCLKEVVVSQRCDFNRMRGSVYMVFEYIEHDLTGLVESRGFELTAGHVKCYMKQLLAALTYIHSRKVPIVHRDIKGSNLLIGRDHVLKLADWGLSRTLNRKAPKLRGYATEVVTIWYRAPELLLGKPDYDGAIDVWAFGCLFAELMMGQPLLPGYTPAEQVRSSFLCLLHRGLFFVFAHLLFALRSRPSLSGVSAASRQRRTGRSRRMRRASCCVNGDGARALRGGARRPKRNRRRAAAPSCCRTGTSTSRVASSGPIWSANCVSSTTPRSSSSAKCCGSIPRRGQARRSCWRAGTSSVLFCTVTFYANLLTV